MLRTAQVRILRRRPSTLFGIAPRPPQRPAPSSEHANCARDRLMTKGFREYVKALLETCVRLRPHGRPSAVPALTTLERDSTSQAAPSSEACLEAEPLPEDVRSPDWADRSSPPSVHSRPARQWSRTAAEFSPIILS